MPCRIAVVLLGSRPNQTVYSLSDYFFRNGKTLYVSLCVGVCLCGLNLIRSIVEADNAVTL